MGREVREAAKHPPLHRTAARTRDSAAANVSGAEMGKACVDQVPNERSNQSILKETSPECSLERLMLKLTRENSRRSLEGGATC